MDLTRRSMCLAGGATAAGASLGLTPSGALGARPAATGADLHLEMRAVVDRVGLRDGPLTTVWRYRAELLRGDPAALRERGGPYLGPILRVRRGQRLRVDLLNELPEPTIVHWHGLHLSEEMDGHPRFAVGPGERYVYEFTVNNRAGTYWFHPHPHGRTGAQVHHGLAGMMIVTDEEEAALGLPSGDEDVPLVLQDRVFDEENQMIFLGETPAGGRGVGGPAARRGGGMMGGGMGGMMGGDMGGMMGGGMGGMMAAMMGMFGDRILVNGAEQPVLEFAPRPHRLRLLNGSNTRIYKLAWDDRSPLTVIATDGGLLSAPVQRPYLMLAPGERADLWVDFGRWPAGTRLTLRSLGFDPGTGGMMGGMMGSGSLPDGAPFTVLEARVADGPRERARPLPARLARVPAIDLRGVVNPARPKVFELTMGMMAWGINGRGFEMHGASALETVRMGTREVWEFRNDGRSSMMGMSMPHAMHVHGLQYRVLGRSGAGAGVRSSQDEGLLDAGWKDTVLVRPGERVRILTRFEEHPGLFLYHCHMLEHEDQGLMRNYRVLA